MLWRGSQITRECKNVRVKRALGLSPKHVLESVGKQNLGKVRAGEDDHIITSIEGRLIWQ